jgi:hypothetical protein
MPVFHRGMGQRRQNITGLVVRNVTVGGVPVTG